jgi:hypothetical protein
MTMTTELVELADRLEAFTRVSESGRSDDGIEGAIIPGKDCYDFDDDMMAAATAIRALASRAGEWLPIESAPETERILIFKDGKQYAAQWVKNPWTGDVAWSLGELGEGNRALVVGPSLWQPLPAAPEPVAVGSSNLSNDEEEAP